MTDLELYKSFVFRQFTFAPGHRAGYPNGAPYHYVGYLHRGTARLAGEDGVLELKEGDLFISRGVVGTVLIGKVRKRFASIPLLSRHFPKRRESATDCKKSK